jgi:hypothetical protein
MSVGIVVLIDDGGEYFRSTFTKVDGTFVIAFSTWVARQQQQQQQQQ